MTFSGIRQRSMAEPRSAAVEAIGCKDIQISNKINLEILSKNCDVAAIRCNVRNLVGKYLNESVCRCDVAWLAQVLHVVLVFE